VLTRPQAIQPDSQNLAIAANVPGVAPERSGAVLPVGARVGGGVALDARDLADVRERAGRQWDAGSARLVAAWSSGEVESPKGYAGSQSSLLMPGRAGSQSRPRLPRPAST